MRILIATQYFPPEVGAAQQRLSFYAEWLAGRGHDVSVVTAMPSYPWGRTLPPYRGRLFAQESAGAVRITRVPTRALGDAPGPGRRLLNYGTFAIASTPAMAALAHRSDVTLVETPPLSMAVSAFTSTSLGTPFVLSVSDVWPQSAVDIGALSNRRTIAFAERVERRVYERAVAVICLTRGIELHVSAIIGKERTYFIPNGIDPTLFGLAPQAPHRDRFLITYAGTIGLAQGLDNAVRAMASLKDKATLTIIGGGAARTSLEAQTAVEGASNVDFMPTLSRAEVIAQLQRSDAVLVSLRDTPMLRGAVPSKLYEAMASGRPVLLVAAGEAADLVRSVSCGIVVAPGDPVALSRAIISLSLDSGRDAMGERGRDFVFAHRDVNDLASQLEALLCRSAEQ